MKPRASFLSRGSFFVMAIVTSSRKPKKQKGIVGISLVLLALFAVIAILILRNEKGGSAIIVPPQKTEPKAITPKANVDVTNTPVATAISTNTAIQPTVKPTTKAQAEEQIKKVAPTNHVLSYRNHPSSSYIKSEADQIIVFAMQGADYLGGMPPLPVMNFPDGGNQAFLDSLTNEIVILGSDTPEVREQKELIIDCRKQIKAIIDNGGTFMDAIKEYQNRINENANLRLAAIRRYQQLKAEDPEAAEEYRKVVNEELEREGITPISVGRGRGRGKSK